MPLLLNEQKSEYQQKQVYLPVVETSDSDSFERDLNADHNDFYSS